MLPIRNKQVISLFEILYVSNFSGVLQKSIFLCSVNFIEAIRYNLSMGGGRIWAHTNGQ